MAKQLKPGENAGQYTIVRLLSMGGTATAYEAVSEKGIRVFLKVYRSPSVQVEWYGAYVAYQKELIRRVKSSAAKEFCYEFVDQFEIKHKPRAYCQVFEFIDSGTDLCGYLEAKHGGKSASWDQRVLFAKVFLAGLSKLHEAEIVHSDLKPENVHLITASDVKAGFRLKLIDMDFSLLAGRKAPWSDDRGYFGTPNYLSPEHLKGLAPVAKSDVFTAALILCELLREGGHPYAVSDPETYAKAVLSGPARVKLGMRGSTGIGPEFAEFLKRALDPNIAIRPAASELHRALLGIATPIPAVKPSTPKPAGVPKAPTPKIPSPVPGAPKPVLELHANGRSKQIRIRTALGKSALSALGADAKYLAPHQFTVEPRADGWYIVPCAGTPNETWVNGSPIVKATRLEKGSVVSVGNKAAGVQKLAMKVEII